MLKKFTEKILYLSSELPSDFGELKSITVDGLLYDSNRLPPRAINYLNKREGLLAQFEGLKQFNAEYYKNNINVSRYFIKAIFYNDLWSFVIFYEIWKDFIDEFDQNNFSTIKKVNDIMSSNLINKVRNSIAHLDVDFNKNDLILKDRNYSKNFKIIDVVSLASWLLTVLIIMAHSQKIQQT